MKSDENCSSSFREEDIEILHNFIHFIHVYSPKARADNSQGKNFDVTKKF